MALTIGSTIVMRISGIGFIVTLAYLFGHITYLYGFKDSYETFAIIKEFHHDYDASYENSGEPVLEYYNEYTKKNIKKQMMNTNISPLNASVGDYVRIQYTNKKERITEPKYITENTYKIQKYTLPPLICATVCFASFNLLILSIFLEHFR